MNILVAGATGRVGSATVRHSLALGHRVRALVRRPHATAARQLAELGAELVEGDMLQPATLGAACAGVDVVCSAATAQGHVAAIEGQGNTHLINAALAAGVGQYLYISAVGADRADGVPDLGTKGQVEALLRASDIHSTVLRPTILHETLRFSLAGPIAFVAGRQSRLFGWIAADDVGHAMALCCGRNNFYDRIIELCGPELLTFDQAYAALGRGQGYRVLPLHVPLALMNLGAPFAPAVAELTGLLAFFDRNGAPGDTSLVEYTFGFRAITVEAWARGQSAVGSRQ